MTHLNQPSQDPAYDDFLARKRFSSWAELCPPSADLISVPKLWVAFFMGLLMRPDSFEWARKFLLSGAHSAFMEPNMETIPIKIPPQMLAPSLPGFACGGSFSCDFCSCAQEETCSLGRH
ncbi:hypothetical protein Zm00014a_030490 [Zea mays]|uniref:Uncharacterized protein n=1 Tax=Zea mays TaxID=4577 RepID=A0A3L6FAT7_MAIZE|nr:hypothetical protein Zm00014a_030490 [Zea mays]